ncbi:MAG: BLUF domain-containing protein [Hyphomonadaceae bacterium]|nr:BLUF domain-containing protein [Hyphomonadaceae bacterium]
MAPSGSLHRLIYLSSAVGVLRADELDRIYLRSQASNGGAGVTGLLLFVEGSFLQVLEGPAAGVASLMQKIRRDRRHTGITTLYSGACAERTFADSPLHYVPARNLSVGEKSAFADLRQTVQARSVLMGPPAPSADHGLSAFLTSFAEVRTA